MKLKFRAWDKKTKWMLKWSDILEGKIGNAWSLFMETLRGDNSRFILMQYTGLLDKGGKEIYEGDIVKYNCDYNDEDTLHQVKWFGDEGYPAFDLEPSLDVEMNGLSLVDSNDEGYTLEIIGNIYSNPKLLLNC